MLAVVISILLENSPGHLALIAGLFLRRQCYHALDNPEVRLSYSPCDEAEANAFDDAAEE